MITKKTLFYFSLTSLLGIIIFLPQTDYLPLLSTGDHGRAFYIPLQVLNGQLPLRDFSHVYGPLMPFYFAFFYKLLGIEFTSILIGEIILKILSGIFIFKILRMFSPHLWAMIATVWLWTNFHFFPHTFNHTGAIFLQLGIIYTLIAYCFSPSNKYIFFSFFAICLISLIKLNFGLFSFVHLMLSLWILFHFKVLKSIPPKKLFFYFPLFTILTIFLPYHFLTKNLSPYEFLQCFSVTTEYRQILSPITKNILNLFTLITKYIKKPLNLSFALIACLTFFRTVTILAKKDQPLIKQKRLFFVILFLFIGLQSHEYILSGVGYRINAILPFLILFIFFCIYICFENSSHTIHKIILIFLTIHILTQHQILIQKKIKKIHLLKTAHHQIYVGNNLPWLNTVWQTTRFLETHLKDTEEIYIIPYSPLYYFLLDKQHPTWLMTMFAFRNIPKIQELEIIRDLENKQVQYVLIDNRLNSMEEGLGYFGQTHGTLIKPYLDKNYELIAEFGKFEWSGGWAWDHATRILKRKDK